MREKMRMKEKGTSVSANSLIWFGAGVSIAEILTGTYLTPLGFVKGLAAIVLGHVIGCMLLFMAGLIGGHTRRSSMETVKMSFGQKGSLLFCGLNVLQLVGWTSIMIYDGGLDANGIYDAGLWAWCLVIGGLILVWLLIGIRNLGKINTAAMAALFVLTLILCRVIFTGNVEPSAEAGGSLSFGAAVELSVAMPLSWLPLISDYTREAERPFGATAASAVVYGLVSCFMYVIGMGAAIYTGEYDISVIMVKAGLGAAGLLIIVLSTVTTTFLDAYSAGVSSVSITHRIKEKWAAVAVTIIGTAAAMVYPMDNITDFLYLIGSVFAPMIAIQIADYFIIRQDHEAEAANLPNLVIWLAGFVIYRILMRVDTPVGSTLPDMAATVVLCVVCSRVTAAVRAFPGRENVTKV
ncbi:putative hydroxymethylpyrimidine transporter CytX [Enterocloster clostridioformis]